MVALRELSIEPQDIDRVSIACKSCDARIELSLGDLRRSAPQPDVFTQRQCVSEKCPSCGDEWKDTRNMVEQFGRMLHHLVHSGITFRVTDAAPEK